MELILQVGLEHQQIPVDAVCDIFSSVHFEQPGDYFSNPVVDMRDYNIVRNIDGVQIRNDIARQIRGKTPPDACLGLDIKMETGTGKTYVYTKTIYELHKRYGVNKFVLAVPTLPIKAGCESFMADPYVRKHFKDTCGYGADMELCVLNAMKLKKGKRFFPTAVRAFVEGSSGNRNKIYVLLVNISLLTTGRQLSRDDYDFGVHGYFRPFDAVRSTRPFVIIDEPHKFARDQKGFKIIMEELAPQCIVRYGATFPMAFRGKGRNKKEVRDYVNLLYNLDACTSFNSNLIKGVAKEHFQPDSSRNEKIKITSIENRESVSLSYRTASGNRQFSLRAGDSLGIISSALAGLTLDAVGKGVIMLSNGQEKRTGEEFEVSIYSSSYQEQMIRLALQRHFETERENFGRELRIKTLALFFIDSIESYRGDSNGEGAWLRDTFDRLLKEALDRELSHPCSDAYREYLEASRKDIAACRAGYFAQDNNDTDEAVAKEVNDILHNKKELLSFVHEDGTPNTRRFLFSKWTLKEGWDNPNVFTITKLRSSGSENSKLQEVGRGLRLPVDESGNRISNEEFMLNYIVDFTEADFADKLVRQINSEMPAADIIYISGDDLERVAALRSISDMDLMVELYAKKYIVNTDRVLNPDKLCEFYEEYPEFNKVGVSKSKVVDRNKKTTNRIGIRKKCFEDLRELWNVLNRKYVIFFDAEVDKLVEEHFPSLVAKGVFTYQTMRSEREVLNTADGTASVLNDAGVEYQVTGKKMPYRDFLIRAHRATSVPIDVIHKAISGYAVSHNFPQEYINEDSLARLIQVFNDWKCEHLQGRFNYRKADYSVLSSALTDENGHVRSEIVQGLIGVHLEKGIVSDKYLYDAVAYDSDLERDNIRSEIQQVVVYGKIPRRSISIPTIADSSYSPDFMYVVEKTNGEKEMNVVVETKGVENKYELRGNELAKISCAGKFFEQLKADGFNVKFRTQLSNKSMRAIISELMVED